jgi:hypothetical protein
MNTFIEALLSADQGDGPLPLPLWHVPGQCILGHLGEVVPVKTPQASALLAENVAGSVFGDAAVIGMIAPQEVRHAPAHRDAHHDGEATPAAFEATLDGVGIPGHVLRSL